MAGNDAFVANVSHWRMIVLMLLGAGFVALGILLVTLPGQTWDVRAAGWAGILFFGACTLIGVRQLFRRGPAMRVDARGIWWARWSDATIPWAAIDRVTLRSMQGQRFVCLFLRDPGAYRSTSTLGRLAGANAALGYGDVSLTVAGTDGRFDDLVATVERYMPVSRG